MRATRRRPRRGEVVLAAAAVMAAAVCLASAAATVDDAVALVTADPANRSASPEVSRLIAGLMAEKGVSEAVRTRARAIAGPGPLTLGVGELLAEVGQQPPDFGAVTEAVPVAATPVAAGSPAPVAAATPPAAQPVKASTRVRYGGWGG